MRDYGFGPIGGVRLKIRTLFIAFLNEEAPSLPLWMKYMEKRKLKEDENKKEGTLFTIVFLSHL